MKTKKKKSASAFTFKELLFAYLAISKVFYWIDSIGKVLADDLGEALPVLIERLLFQDLITILILIAMFFLTHYMETHPGMRGKFMKHLLLYGVGWVIYIGIIVGYLTLANILFASVTIQIDNWLIFIREISMIYLICCVVLEVKDRLKKKENALYIPAPDSPEEKLALLTALHEGGLLTEAEFTQKKEMATVVS